MKPFRTAIIFFLCIGKCSAQQQPEPIETDRPDQTETPVIVPTGYFQIETGFSYERTDESTTSIGHPSSLFKYGMISGFEFRLEAEIRSLKTHGENAYTGLEPLSVGFKAHLWDENGIVPYTSLLGHLILPYTGTRSFRGSYYGPGFRFSMRNIISSAYQIGYNFGAEWDADKTAPSFIYTFTNGISLSEQVAIFLEAFGSFSARSEADHEFDAGISSLFSDDTLADLSGGFGITRNAPQFFCAIGFSFRFNTK